jgi:hypothetical protein
MKRDTTDDRRKRDARRDYRQARQLKRIADGLWHLVHPVIRKAQP